MLLITDRLEEGRRLQQALGPYRTCDVISLLEALAHAPGQSCIMLDLALDNVTTVELVRAALAHHRTAPTIPVLCLTRDPSKLALAQARALGATETIPHNSPVAQIRSAIDRMTISLQSAKADEVTRRATQHKVLEAGSAFSDLFEAAKRHQSISVATLDRGGDIVLAALKQTRIRVWLDIVSKYDDLTYQHCLLVAGLVAAFTLKLALSLKSQRLLSQAALVHDIGKARIAHSILNKPGPLTQPEMEVMKTHPAAGFDLLVEEPKLDPNLLDIVRHHHEYMDGSGYPDGLREHQISYFVRIVTICDIYAALVERRPYRAPMPAPQALSILVDMGRKLDGSLVDAFHDIISEGRPGPSRRDGAVSHESSRLDR